MPARRRGWGRLRKLPSGRWQASYTGPDLAVHKAVATFQSALDAEGWLTDERRLIDSGRWTPPHTRNAARPAVETFSAYAESWLKMRADSGRIKPRTTALYRALLDRHLLPTFGDQPMTAITPSDVKRWYADLDTGPSGRANCYGLLRTIAGEAVDDGVIPVSPVRIKGAGSKKRERELKVLSVTEFETIVEVIPPRYKALVLLAGWCGLRFGELAALRRSDVDLKARTVHVRHSLVTLKGEKFLGPPKSDAGRRDVSIPPHIVPALREHLAEHAAFGKDGLVFPAANGKDFLALSTLHRVFGPAKEKAGRPDVRVHDLRHFGAIMAARAGATLGELQQRLGHSTAQAALIYQGAVSDRHTELAERLSAMAADNTPS